MERHHSQAQHDSRSFAALQENDAACPHDLNAHPKPLDLLILWDWEFDYDFIRWVKETCRAAGLGVEDILIYNLSSPLSQAILNGELRPRFLLDRATDTNPQFLPLYQAAEKNGAYLINPTVLSQRVCDKATMHYELIHNGVHVPYTILLPPFDHMPRLDDYHLAELRKLHAPYVVKPANGGGGEGVHPFVRSHDFTSSIRKEWPWDRYLAQEKIQPRYLYGSRCWFRVYYLFGEIDAVWWNDETKIYKSLAKSEYQEPWFSELSRTILNIQHAITRLTGRGMDYFSSEIAITKSNTFVAVDYVNDQIDLRPKSRHFDGVPDSVIRKLISALVKLISNTT